MKLFYHDEVGRLTGQLQAALTAEELEEFRARGVLFIVVPDNAPFAGHFALEGDLAVQPVAPITINRTEIPADKRTKVKIAGLPDPCIVLVDGKPVTVGGGLLELTADMPATYSVVFDQFPFVSWSVDIIAS